MATHFQVSFCLKPAFCFHHVCFRLIEELTRSIRNTRCEKKKRKETPTVTARPLQRSPLLCSDVGCAGSRRAQTSRLCLVLTHVSFRRPAAAHTAHSLFSALERAHACALLHVISNDFRTTGELGSDFPKSFTLCSE